MKNKMLKYLALATLTSTLINKSKTSSYNKKSLNPNEIRSKFGESVELMRESLESMENNELIKFYQDTQLANPDLLEPNAEDKLVFTSNKKPIIDNFFSTARSSNAFTLYFDSDSSYIHYESKIKIILHATFMTRYPSLKLTLTGHTDGRGTREYNIALGEKRADSANAQLQYISALDLDSVLNLGLGKSDLSNLSNRIDVLSYGEEKPRVNVNNPDAWNRRVEFEYKIVE